MRKLWNSVNGERLWYALHGYDIQAQPAERGMFGHGRVLPPESRSLPAAYEICRLLLIKAARRLRRAGYYCNGLMLWLALRGGEWSDHLKLPIVNDDQAVLAGLARLWERVRRKHPGGTQGRSVMSGRQTVSGGHFTRQPRCPSAPTPALRSPSRNAPAPHWRVSRR